MLYDAGQGLLGSSDSSVLNHALVCVFSSYEFQHRLGSMAYISWESTTHGSVSFHWTLCPGAGVEICNGDGNQSFTTGGTIDSTPAVSSDGIVYVNVHFCCNSGAGALYAVNRNGSLRWMFPPVGCPTSCVDWLYGSPTLSSDGTVYIAMSINDFFGIWAIKPDGSVKWFVSTGGIVYGSPAVAPDGTVYGGVDDPLPPPPGGECAPGLCSAYSNGTVAWNAKIGWVFGSSPVVSSDGIIYVTGALYGFSAIRRDGTIEWNQTGVSTGDSTPAIGPTGTIYVESSNYLYALATDGSIRWKFPIVSSSFNVGPRSDPAIDAKGNIFAGSSDGNMYALSPNGILLWRLALGGAVGSPVIDLGRTIYVGSSDGTLYAIGGPPSLQ